MLLNYLKSKQLDSLCVAKQVDIINVVSSLLETVFVLKKCNVLLRLDMFIRNRNIYE